MEQKTPVTVLADEILQFWQQSIDVETKVQILQQMFLHYNKNNFDELLSFIQAIYSSNLDKDIKQKIFANYLSPLIELLNTTWEQMLLFLSPEALAFQSNFFSCYSTCKEILVSLYCLNKSYVTWYQLAMFENTLQNAFINSAHQPTAEFYQDWKVFVKQIGGCPDGYVELNQLWKSWCSTYESQNVDAIYQFIVSLDSNFYKEKFLEIYEIKNSISKSLIDNFEKIAKNILDTVSGYSDLNNFNQSIETLSHILRVLCIVQQTAVGAEQITETFLQNFKQKHGRFYDKVQPVLVKITEDAEKCLSHSNAQAMQQFGINRKIVKAKRSGKSNDDGMSMTLSPTAQSQEFNK